MYDISSPTAPVLLGTGATVGDAYGVALGGPIVYVADFPAVLSVFALP